MKHPDLDFLLVGLFITILISLLVIGLLIFLLFPDSFLGVSAFLGICPFFLHCPLYWLIVVYRNILWLYFCGVCLFHFWFWHSAHALQQEKLPQWDTYALRLESKPYLLQLQKALCSNKEPMHCNKISVPPKRNTLIKNF